MYSNLIQEDIMTLDNEFFKINTMFETVDKMYDIKMKELEYNYIYTESINEEYIDLYTEAEEAKSKNEQGLLGRLFTAILNFIRKIRAKILRFFGNDKKASELEAKIKGNPKLANQTVEITNTADAEKAIDEGTSFFGSLIDKIVKGTATEKDADDAEEKNKSLLSRIGIFAGGALLAAGGAKVTSDKLKERGVTKQTIKEAVSNLLKREEDTKKKSTEVTQTNEQNVQKAQQAMNNNSQNGNEENTKAGRRIVGSFKDFITDVGKFFTGKASEIRSKINGVSSQERPKNTNTQQANDDTQQTEQKNLTPDEYYKKTIKSEKQKEFFKFKDENDKMIDEIQDYLVEISRETRLNGQNIISEYDIILKGSKRAKPHIPPSMTFEKIKTYNQKLKELLDKSKKEYEDLKSKNNTTSDSFAAATASLSSMKKDKNDESKPENNVEKQSETSASKEQIKNTNTQQANDKQNQKNDNKQWNQSIDYRKDFAERLLEHESIDTVPRLKTELERIIKNGKYTDEEYKRMGEIEDRLQFEMILQKVYDDRDKLNSNDQKILDTLIRKTNITANDDKELTILLNKVQYVKYNKKKRNKSNEQQANDDTQQTEQKKGNKTNSDIVRELHACIRDIMTRLDVTSDIDKDHPPKNVNVFGRKAYYLIDDAHSVIPIRKTRSNYELDKKYLESLIEFADYLNKIRNNINFDELCKYQKMEGQSHKKYIIRDINDEYSDMNKVLDDAKKNLKEIEEYERQQKSSKTTNESSYDLINDILTIFENSF